MIIEQLIKKNCKTGEVQEVNPITSFEAVKDPETGNTLKDILINGNHIYVPFTSNSKAITRSQVPMNYRRRGLWITYVSCQGKVTTEWYNSDNFDDVNWGNNSNWVKYIDDQYIKDLVTDFVQEQFGDIDLRIDNNTKAIENIIGTSGAASKDEFINTITDITRFFTGYTTSDTLKGVIDSLDVSSKETLASAIAAVNNTIQQVDNKIQEVQDNIEQVEETVEDVRAAAVYASNTAEETSAKVTDLSNQVTTLDSTLRSEVATIKASVNDVDTKVTNLENQIGAASGIAPLGPDGRIPSSNLPSYVDDVLEYDSIEEFPAQGEEGKIYVAKDVNLTYRWSGTQYTEISPSIGLGETAQTAYAGDKGKKNADDIAELKTTVQGHEVKISDLEKEAVKYLTSEEVEAYTPENPGVLIYNTTTNKYQYWDGTKWSDIGSGAEVSSKTWLITNAESTYNGEPDCISNLTVGHATQINFPDFINKEDTLAELEAAGDNVDAVLYSMIKQCNAVNILTGDVVTITADVSKRRNLRVHPCSYMIEDINSRGPKITFLLNDTTTASGEIFYNEGELFLLIDKVTINQNVKLWTIEPPTGSSLSNGGTQDIVFPSNYEKTEEEFIAELEEANDSVIKNLLGDLVNYYDLVYITTGSWDSVNNDVINVTKTPCSVKAYETNDINLAANAPLIYYKYHAIADTIAEGYSYVTAQLKYRKSSEDKSGSLYIEVLNSMSVNNSVNWITV